MPTTTTRKTCCNNICAETIKSEYHLVGKMLPYPTPVETVTEK